MLLHRVTSLLYSSPRLGGEQSPSCLCSPLPYSLPDPLSQLTAWAAVRSLFLTCLISPSTPITFTLPYNKLFHLLLSFYLQMVIPMFYHNQPAPGCRDFRIIHPQQHIQSPCKNWYIKTIHANTNGHLKWLATSKQMTWRNAKALLASIAKLINLVDKSSTPRKDFTLQYLNRNGLIGRLCPLIHIAMSLKLPGCKWPSSIMYMLSKGQLRNKTIYLDFEFPQEHPWNCWKLYSTNHSWSFLPLLQTYQWCWSRGLGL